MLVTAAVVVFFMLVFAGVGLLALPGRDDRHPERLIAAAWGGWALSIVFLQVWQLLAPVSLISLALLLAAAVGGYARSFRWWSGWLRGPNRGAGLVVAAFAGAFLLLLANQATFSRYSYDHGLYHLQMVKWLTTYPLVPGLGNLHHRFAFNNSSFLYAAQMNVGPLEGLAHQTASTLLMFLLALRGMVGVYRLMTGSEQGRAANVYYVLFIPFLLSHVLTSAFAGYSTDLVIFALQVLLAGELLELFSSADPVDRRRRATWIVLLAAVGVTVKLSFVVFAALAALAAMLRTVGSLRGLWSSGMARWIGVGALAIVPWLARHVILSGYLLYPSTMISFPVPWRIPRALAEPIAQGITEWARELGSGTIPPDQWFPNWFSVFPFELKEALAYTALILLAVLALRLFLRLAPLDWRVLTVLLGISFAALLYWFWMAPSLRFVGALFWLPIVLGLMLLYGQLVQLPAVRAPHMLLAFLLLLLMLWLSPDFKSVSTRTAVMPPREHEVAAANMRADPERFEVTRSGLKVYIAAGEADELCWDQPLPCTRLDDFDPRLTLIDPQNMRRGLRIQLSE